MCTPVSYEVGPFQPIATQFGEMLSCGPTANKLAAQVMFAWGDLKVIFDHPLPHAEPAMCLTLVDCAKIRPRRQADVSKWNESSDSERHFSN